MPGDLRGAVGARLCEIAERPANGGPFEAVAAGHPLAPAEAMAWQHHHAMAVGHRERPPGLLLWESDRDALMVPRRDAAAGRFHRAASELAERGWPVTVRGCGGGAFPVGRGTLQLALAWPRGSRAGESIESVYRALAGLVVEGLEGFGLRVRVGAVPGAFCRGRYDIGVDGRKLAGTSQMWRGPAGAGGYILATATLLIDVDPRRLTRVVNRFYGGLGVSACYSAAAVTSVRGALDCVRAQHPCNMLTAAASPPLDARDPAHRISPA